MTLQAIQSVTIFCLLTSTAFAYGETLTPANRLHRMSMKARSKGTEPKENEDLKGLQGAQLDKFFTEKAQEYVSSKEFIFTMNHKLDELFRVRASISNRDEELKLYSDSLVNNAMDELFQTVVRENRNWDELLVGKKYSWNPRSKLGGKDLGFFKALFPEQLPESSTWGVLTELRNDSFVERFDYSNINRKGFGAKIEDTRLGVEAQTDVQKQGVAGAITTSRFFERYTTTFSNRNRRRAAAVFRTFLCDDMQPAFIPSDDEEAKLKNLAFELHSDRAKTIDPAKPSVQGRHDADPSCQACHRKLDPMGETFQGSSVVLSPYPGGGALVLMRNRQELRIPVSGIGELAEKITEQPEYVNCQVRHFWSWFVGENVPLTDQRLAELVQAFNRVGRKPQTFVAYLMNQPEFYTKPQTEPNTVPFATVKAIFNRCDDCHVMEGNPSFTEFPIGGNQLSHVKWMQKISTQLDLLHYGANRKMPKANSQWQPSRTDLSLIANWIKVGAPDQNNQPTLSADEVGSIPLPGDLK